MYIVHCTGTCTLYITGPCTLYITPYIVHYLSPRTLYNTLADWILPCKMHLNTLVIPFKITTVEYQAAVFQFRWSDVMKWFTTY